MKFDEFQGVQVAAGGEVPLPQHQIVRAHGLQDALLPHQAVRAHQEAGGRAAANVPAQQVPQEPPPESEALCMFMAHLTHTDSPPSLRRGYSILCRGG